MTYKKRVAFVISSQHFIPHGGIGQFAKGFSAMAKKLGWVTDIIADKNVENTALADVIRDDVGLFVSPTQPMTYADHNNVFAFSDSYNLEKMVNFRSSIMEAFQRNLYDLIIVNTPEAMVPVYGLGIWDLVPCMFYTHNENLLFKNNDFKGVFNKSYGYFFSEILKMKGVITGTQSTRNVEGLKENGAKPVLIPMPMSEDDLLNPSDHYEKEGVLFIGRWEERKSPKDYLQMIAETGYKAKVMTNETGKKKFEKELEKLGVEYDIRASITGQEKVEFIKSSRMHFMPSKSEVYPFAFMETVGHMPVVVFDQYSWHDSFDDKYFFKVNKKNVYSEIKRLYNNEPVLNLEYIQSLMAGVSDKWQGFMKKSESLGKDIKASSSSVISKKDNLFLDEHVQSLGRFASIEDVISVIRYAKGTEVKYTQDRTWFTSDGMEPKVVESNDTLEDFFT